LGGRITIVRTVLVSLVALLPSFSREARAGTAGDIARASSPRLRLVWIDVLGSASYAFASATREATAILGDAGVATVWTVATPSTETTDDELKILVLGDAGEGSRRSRRIMGCTHRGEHSRTTWVYLSSVLWALGLQSPAGWGLLAREQEEVGRALGRVVAHEIVHVVAPDLPHSRDGLMAGRLSRVLLVCSRVSLTPREGQALRAGLETLASTDDSTGAVERAPETLQPRHPKR